MSPPREYMDELVLKMFLKVQNLQALHYLTYYKMYDLNQLKYFTVLDLDEEFSWNDKQQCLILFGKARTIIVLLSTLTSYCERQASEGN